MKVEVLGVELELVENGFDTRVHCCDGCWFFKTGNTCDNYLAETNCGSTRVYKEVK